MRACVVRALRGVRGAHEHGAALGSTDRWMRQLVAGKVQTNRMSGWSRLNKYSKISNSCISFESNRIASNYSIRFEISNIRTSLIILRVVVHSILRQTFRPARRPSDHSTKQHQSTYRANKSVHVMDAWSTLRSHLHSSLKQTSLSLSLSVFNFNSNSNGSFVYPPHLIRAPVLPRELMTNQNYELSLRLQIFLLTGCLYTKNS